MIEHIDNINLELLKQNRLDKEKKIILLEHIETCEACALKLANLYKTDDLLDTPQGFNENVFHKINTKKSKGQKNKEFIEYSFRVGLAMCASLVLVFANPVRLSDTIKNSNIPTFNLAYVNNITTNIKSFSNKIIIWGLNK